MITENKREPVNNDFSLLVIDMWWERDIKAKESGYDPSYSLFNKKYLANTFNFDLSIVYPHGTPRAGLNAIHDVVRLVHLLGKKIYAVVMDDGCSTSDELLDVSLHPYVPERNLFFKKTNSAFRSSELARQLELDDVNQLMVVGFDRDFCVFETIKDAAEKNLVVVTPESLMLTNNTRGTRELSLDYFRKNTTYLETLVDVWNFLDPQGRLDPNP